MTPKASVDDDLGFDQPASEKKRWTRWLRPRRLATLVLLPALLSSPFWGPRAARRMAYFHVRRVEIFGARYVSPSDILARLHVDTLASVWEPTEPLAARVARHPEIAHAVVRRRLPGTLVVEVTERVPVALIPTPD